MNEEHAARMARAEAFAVEAHGDQRYGPHPYRHHLVRVVSIAREFGADEDTQVAAWMHDSVEDTPVTREQVAEKFGARVAELVWAVTDEPGANRKERHAKTYPKTRAVEGGVILKLCDRLANVRACLADHPRKLKMYRTEYPHFRGMLHDGRGGIEAQLWDVLDAILEWPVDDTDATRHPAYREYRRRMAEEPTPGQGSRVALDELDQIGVWAGQWVRDMAPPAVRAVVLAELEAAVPDGGRAYWDKEATALRVIRGD